MNNRLVQFLAAENISQSQFADTIGVARASVSHIIAERNKPGFDFIKSTAEHYPNLNLEWLIAGRGRMYKNIAGREEEEYGKAKEDQADETVSLFSADEDTQAATNPAPTQASAEIPHPQEAKAQNSVAQNPDTQRKIAHILVLYDDGTFSLMQ